MTYHMGIFAIHSSNGRVSVRHVKSYVSLPPPLQAHTPPAALVACLLLKNIFIYTDRYVIYTTNMSKSF